MGFLRGLEPTAALLATARGLTLVLVLVSGAGAQRNSGSGESGADPHTFEQVQRAFLPPHTTAELRRRLGALESGAIPHLFLLAATGNLPRLNAAGSDPLSMDDRATLREVLAARPRRELVVFLEDLANRVQEVSIRLEAQRLLGTIGTGEHLKLLVRLTTCEAPGPSVTPPLRIGFTRAFEQILGRAPGAVAQVPMLVSESSPGLASSLIEALASVKSAESTRTLASLLGRAPGLDALLLARLSERGRLNVHESRTVCESVRRYLRQRDPGLVVAAVQVAGRMEDGEAVESLIQLMEHADERVTGSVFEALERISGLALGPDPAQWSRWYHEETRWWDTEAESRLVSIERGQGLEFVRAAREALEHRLYRDRIAESFALALRRDNPEEVRLACGALERLRSLVAVRELVELLGDDDPLLRAAALRALRAITGQDLPPDVELWSALAN